MALPQWHRLVRAAIWLQKARAKAGSRSQVLSSFMPFLTRITWGLSAGPGLVHDMNFELWSHRWL